MNKAALYQARILIVDDHSSNIQLLEDVLQQAGYTNVLGETDSQKAIAHYESFHPDLILLDLLMPHMDGFAVMEALKKVVPVESYMPILVLTADITRDTKRRALSSGAKDFLTKPIDATEVILRMHNLLETRYLHMQLHEHNQRLQEEVLARTKELEESRIETLQRLASAVEYRDDETGEHTRRVGETSARIATRLHLPADQIELIRLAAPLHDVGKIGISDTILLKPGGLTDEEYNIMKSHTTIGAALLANGRSQLIQVAEQIALAHHERWNGSGYPYKIAGEQIALVGRIVAVADVFDALTHARPYKAAWTVEDALTEIASQSGRQFDPAVVQAFQQIDYVL